MAGVSSPVETAGLRARWAELVGAHEAALRSVAATLCRGQSALDADDLVQEVFERAFRHLAAGRAEPTSPRAWLVSILRHAAVDRFRVTKHHVEPDDDLVAPEPLPEPPWSGVSIADVRGALATLPADLGAPFQLHYLEHVPYAAIAERLGIPANTVASRLFRARKALRAALLARVEGRP